MLTAVHTAIRRRRRQARWLLVALAVAATAMTALATAQGADRLGDAVALTDGYSAAFLGAAGIAAAGGLLAAALLRVPKPATDAADGARDDDRELIAA